MAIGASIDQVFVLIWVTLGLFGTDLGWSMAGFAVRHLGNYNLCCIITSISDLGGEQDEGLEIISTAR